MSFAQKFHEALMKSIQASPNISRLGKLQLQKAMSRSEAASLAGKASAAARKAKAGGSGQTTDFKSAQDKANRLIASGAKGSNKAGGKGKGKGKAAAKPKDPAAQKEKEAAKAQAQQEHAQRLKEHEEDRSQRQADRQQKQVEHQQDRQQKQSDREQKQKEHADQLKAKAKAASSKKSSSSSKSSDQQAKKQEAADNKSKAAGIAARFASGGQVTQDEMSTLVGQGLAEPRADGGLQLTGKGKSAAKTSPIVKPDGGLQMQDTPAPSKSRPVHKLEKAHFEGENDTWHGWAEITKLDEEKRFVFGIASTEMPDNQPGIWKGDEYAGDIITSDAMRDAAPAYLEFPAIREMHQPSAAGTAVHFDVVGAETEVGAFIVDDQAWRKVVTKVYRGFSIGAKLVEAEIVKLDGLPYRRITKIRLTEISLVDRPANPQARITLFKGDDMPADQIEEVATETASTDDATIIAKAADPTKAIGMLQQLRNDAELAGDMDAADGYTAAIRSTSEAAGIATTAADDEDADVADAQSMMDMPDDTEADGDGDMTMADKSGDLKKRGMALSATNMGHAKTAHDALHKMTGGAVCGAGGASPGLPIQRSETLAPDDLAKALQPAFDGIAKVLEHYGLEVITLTKRMEAVEAQPAAGRQPATRLIPVEKTIVGDSPAAPAVVDVDQAKLDLMKAQRDQTTDPAVLKFLGEEIAKVMAAQTYRTGPK